MLTDEHESFPFERREPNNLLIRNHIQLVKNCKNGILFFFCLFVLDKSIKTRKSAVEAASGALTRAVFGQVLVFALLFLPKRAAGLAGLSSLAFTGCPPVLPRQIWVEREYLRFRNAVSAEAAHRIVSARWGGRGVYHSWSSGEGIRPAKSAALFSTLPCHQLGSCLLMIWMTSPVWNLRPASLQGMRSSMAGS